MLGGGMRQAGHLAAAGIVALKQQIDCLNNDHALTAKLIIGLKKIEGIEVNDEYAKTNILFFNLTTNEISPEIFLKTLGKNKIQILMLNRGRFRAVLNRHITEEHVGMVIHVIKKTLG